MSLTEIVKQQLILRDYEGIYYTGKSCKSLSNL
jgi:hypothetical protein